MQHKSVNIKKQYPLTTEKQLKESSTKYEYNFNLLIDDTEALQKLIQINLVFSI